LSDIKFRKISRILISGRVSLCREVFGETLNESRDPEGTGDRYSSRYFLRHSFLEQAFDTLVEANFELKAAAGTSALSLLERDSKSSQDAEENRWLHYNEFVFVRFK
jgi:BTB/POZ domain-containing protein KCTD8/12/16